MATMLLSNAIAYAGSDDCVAPVFTNNPAISVNKNHCSAYRFDFDATEGGNAPSADPVTYATSVGTINAATGQLSIPTLPACGKTPVVVTATNSCGASTDYAFEIVWTNNRPSISNELLSLPLNCIAGEMISYDFNSVDADPCDAAMWSVIALDDVVNAPSVTSTGVFRWVTDVSEGGLLKSFQAIVEDPCGGADTTTFFVSVLDHHLGTIREVSITRLAGTEPIGGFTFLIAFDTPPLSFFLAEPGAGLISCGWEYFTYSYISPEDSGDPDGSTAMVRITATADINDDSGSPLCNQFARGTEIVRLKFYISSDLHYECMAFPIRFAWLGCDDNTAMSVDTETRWISSRVFDFSNQDPFNDPDFEITDTVCHEGIGYGGACRDCEEAAERDIVFWNGYIDNNCNYFVPMADLNGNGIAFEIADAYLYSQYFVYGDDALDPNPKYREFQITQSDANQDGIKLSPADLAYMLRVIVGDALPFPKLQPYSASAQVEVLGNTVSIASDDSIAVISLIFDVIADITVTNRAIWGSTTLSATENCEYWCGRDLMTWPIICLPG